MYVCVYLLCIHHNLNIIAINFGLLTLEFMVSLFLLFHIFLVADPLFPMFRNLFFPSLPLSVYIGLYTYTASDGVGIEYNQNSFFFFFFLSFFLLWFGYQFSDRYCPLKYSAHRILDRMFLAVLNAVSSPFFLFFASNRAAAHSIW